MYPHLIKNIATFSNRQWKICKLLLSYKF